PPRGGRRARPHDAPVRPPCCAAARTKVRRSAPRDTRLTRNACARQAKIARAARRGSGRRATDVCRPLRTRYSPRHAGHARALQTMSGDDTPVTILMPIYDDWESAFVLVGRIVRALAATSFKPTFLLVDDGSSIAPPHALPQVAGGATVDVLHLRRNLGHQRAIPVGRASRPP